MSTAPHTPDAEIDKGDLFLDVYPPDASSTLAAEQSWGLNVASSPIDWQPLLQF